jgi:hypothetical protein
MSSEPTQISMEDRIKSLLQDEALVLYWKCRRYDHKGISEKVHWGTAWVQLRMVRIYKKLGFRKEMHWTRRTRILRREVCPIFNELIKNDIRNIPKVFAPEVEFIEDIEVIEEENQEKSVVQVHHDEEIPVGGILTKEEEVILDLVLYDEMKEDEEAEERENTEPRPPIIIPSQKALPSSTGGMHPIWYVLGVFACLACLGVIAWLGRDRILAVTQPTMTLEPKPVQNTATPNPSVSAATNTTHPTGSPLNSPTPTLSPTSAIPPTAVPWPKENFSQSPSDLWRISGDPIITSGNTYGFDGVLTTKAEETVTLTVGNTAWTDYFVKTRADEVPGTLFETHMIIGVRVVDINNMVQITCKYDQCSWIIVYGGEYFPISGYRNISTREPFTLTAQGDTFTLVGQGPGETTTYQFTIPPKYVEGLSGGGVMLDISNMEVDFIEVQPLN